MAFDGMFEFIEIVQKHVEGAFEKGWIYILIIIGFFGLILTIIVVLVYSFMGQDSPADEIPVEKQKVISYAQKFCIEKGFDSWEWENQTTYKFRCITTEIINETLEIKDYFVS